MGLDNDYYRDDVKEGPLHYRLHLGESVHRFSLSRQRQQLLSFLEHCLDYLRQIVQCGSDLTPLPIVWAEGAGRAVPNFEQPHTCRNFEKIRQWATDKEESTIQAARSSG